MRALRGRETFKLEICLSPVFGCDDLEGNPNIAKYRDGRDEYSDTVTVYLTEHLFCGCSIVAALAIGLCVHCSGIDKVFLYATEHLLYGCSIVAALVIGLYVYCSTILSGSIKSFWMLPKRSGLE